MGIFEATLKEELNKLLVQSSICTSNTIYPTATCHSHHVLTPIAPRHKNYAIFGTVHKYYILFPTYVRAIQPYVFQFISTAFASTQNRSKYSKTISPSNSLLNEGEGWISLLWNSTLRYPFYYWPDATLLPLFLPNVFFNTKTFRCSRFQIIWPMLKNLILGVQFSRFNWFVPCFSGNKSVGDFEATSLFGFTAVAPYWAERS